jgi:hypothetical protein
LLSRSSEELISEGRSTAMSEIPKHPMEVITDQQDPFGDLAPLMDLPHTGIEFQLQRELQRLQESVRYHFSGENKPSDEELIAQLRKKQREQMATLDAVREECRTLLERIKP